MHGQAALVFTLHDWTPDSSWVEKTPALVQFWLRPNTFTRFKFGCKSRNDRIHADIEDVEPKGRARPWL